MPTGDAPCPHCGQLLWFDPVADSVCRFEFSTATPVDATITANRDAAKSFRKATASLAQEDWPYAVEMFSRCAHLTPDNLLFRQTLRGVECRMYDNNGFGVRLPNSQLDRIRGQLEKAKSKQDWATVDRLAEAGLRLRPWDTDLNLELGLASLARGNRDVALFALHCALNSSPDRDDIQAVIAKLEAN